MRRRLAAGLVLVLVLTGCDWVTSRRLAGSWETEALPKRLLELRPDGRYSRRFSGRGLGFVSDVLGPEQGRWRVDGYSLLLTRREGEIERTDRLEIRSLSPSSVELGGEEYERVVDTPVSPR